MTRFDQRAILRRLESPGAFDTLPFADGQVLVLGVRLDAECPVVATPLKQLRVLFPHLRVNVVGVRRESRLFVPSKTDMLMEGDDVYLMCRNVENVLRDRLRLLPQPVPS